MYKNLINIGHSRSIQMSLLPAESLSSVHCLVVEVREYQLLSVYLEQRFNKCHNLTNRL